MANNFEKSMVAVNAYVLFFNHQEKIWTNQTGICNVQVFENQCNKSFRVVGWQLQTKQVVLNCAITKSFRYNQTTSSFHQWNDSIQSVGLNFQDAPDAERFSAVILAAMEVTNTLPLLPRPVDQGVYEPVEVTYPSVIYKQTQPVVSPIEQVDIRNQLRHQNSLPQFPMKQPVPLRTSTIDLSSVSVPPQPTSPPSSVPPSEPPPASQENIPPPPPPPPPPGSNTTGSSDGSGGSESSFAHQLRNTSLRKVSSPVTKSGGDMIDSNDDKPAGRIQRSMSVAKGSDMLSEMQKVLAKRKSRQDSIVENGDKDKEVSSTSKTNDSKQSANHDDDESDEVQTKPLKSLLEKFQSPEGSKVRGRSNSLAPKIENQGSMTVGRNKGKKILESSQTSADDTLLGAKKNLLNNGSSKSKLDLKSSDYQQGNMITLLPEQLETFKKEILREVTKEISAAKREILDTIRLELNKR